MKYFDGELVRPHSDLEVELAGLSCPLDGKLGLVNLREMPPMIGSLEWADIDAVVIDDVDVEATVDLYWTAVGDVYNEFFSEPGQRAAHRTRDATVTGTVTIDGYGEFTVDDLQAAVITRYNEIQRDNLR